MVNQQKQSQVDTLVSLLEKSNNFALIKFEKTLHTTLEALRKELRTTGSQVKVIKNSLFEKALNKMSSGNDKLREFKQKAPLQHNSALVIFGEEWNKGLSVFHKFSDKEQSLAFKAGILDQTVYMGDDLVKIAKLPSRVELIAKVIGSMKSPVSRMNFALKFNLQKFVYILSEKSKQS